jgi:YesN/AraC family two-component response regulator
MGARGYLSKPIFIDEVIELLNRVT